MRILGISGPRAGLLLFILLLVPTAGASGGEDDAFEVAFRGVVFDLLAEFREGDEADRQQAEQGLLARGSFVLPYVLVAAEATPDEAYRARLLSLAERIRTDLPEPTLAYRYRITRDMPGLSEYAPWDAEASNLVNNRWRADSKRLALYSRPTGPKTVLIHVHAERWASALECLIAFARSHPDRIEEALEVARWSNICDSADLADRMAVLEAMATRIMNSSEPERASLIAFYLANLRRDDRMQKLDAVAKEWGEMEGGLRARHEWIEDSKQSGRARLAAQLDLCAKHPRSRATLLGLSNAIFQLSNVNVISKDFNSLARLREVAEVAAQLSSDRLAGGDGCYKAAEYTAEFYISDDISPEEAQEMLAAFRVFFIHNFLVDELSSPAVDFGYYVKSKFTKLHGVLGVPKGEMEPILLKELREIERQVPEKAPVRCFIAQYLAEQGRTDEAVAILEEIQADLPDRFYGRKALAMLATIHYAKDEFAEAAELYTRYASEHPTASCAWVAALRAGHALALAGSFDNATTAWEKARAGFPGHPLIAVLVPLSLGRAFEERGILAEALTQYRSALAAWPHGCKDHLGTPIQGIAHTRRTGFDPDATISRDDLMAKVAELDRPGIDPAELSLYLKAKRSKDQGEAKVAVDLWQRFLELHPNSPLLPEVRGALGRTLIEMAFSAESRQQAEHHLVLAAAEGDRFTAFAVELFRSIADLGVEGGADIARERLGKAVASWERDTVIEEPGTALAKDVAAIRRQMFRPRDAAYFHRGYQPEEWPRYSIVTPEIDLTFPDGRKETISVRHTFPEQKGVLYFTGDELTFITKIIDSFGGGKRTKPEWIMAIPQPDGVAKTIRTFLKPFFRLTPGHWGGWHLRTYPILRTLRFLDAERTGAVVGFRVEYKGGEVRLALQEDGWERGEVKFTWME